MRPPFAGPWGGFPNLPLSRRATKPNDRQLRVPVNVLDFHIEPSAGLTGDECMRPGAGRTSRPARARLDPRLMNWSSEFVVGNLRGLGWRGWQSKPTTRRLLRRCESDL